MILKKLELELEILLSDLESLKDAVLIEKTVATIFSEIEKLDKSSEEYKQILRQRWIWELIQNATDCYPPGKKIDIAITFDNQSLLTFEHNGIGFSAKDLLSLITQTSSKQNNDTTIGHFGTGFISTSLLSPKIMIQSYIEESGQNFTLVLDRSGRTVESIAESVNKNFESLNKVFNNMNPILEKTEKTVFTYNLNDSEDLMLSRKAVENGIQSLLLHLPYLLSFSREINSLSINDVRYSIYSETEVQLFPAAHFVNIQNTNGEKTTIFQVFFGESSFAAPIIWNNQNKYSFSSIPTEVTRLHCKFPLVGTENFPFPVILNSPNFEVEIDRNKIFESSIKNSQIFCDAINIYSGLLDVYQPYEAGVNYLCALSHPTYSAFEKELYFAIKKVIDSKQIVLCSNNSKYSIKDPENKKQIFVPKTEKTEFSYDVWKLFSHIPSLIIPTFENSENWRNIIANDIKLSDIQNKFLTPNYTVNDFINWSGLPDQLTWLNTYYNLCCSLCPEESFSDLMVPNSLGKFVKVSEIYYIQNTFPQLIDILQTIHPEYKSHFAYNGIILNDKFSQLQKPFGNLEIAKKIEDHILVILQRETSETSTLRTEETNHLFKMILDLFLNLGENSIEFFPTLYPERAKLHGKDFAKSLSDLGDTLSNKNISIDRVNNLLMNEKMLNILNSNSVLSDKDLQQLRHTSAQSLWSLKRFEELIGRSITNVYRSLQSNQNYKVPDTLYEWQGEKYRVSKTIFRAEKAGQPIFVVIRPSDNDIVIVYYEEELSVLDSSNYELWIDNGEVVRELTLGEILKTANINMVPVNQPIGG